MVHGAGGVEGCGQQLHEGRQPGRLWGRVGSRAGGPEPGRGRRMGSGAGSPRARLEPELPPPPPPSAPAGGRAGGRAPGGSRGCHGNGGGGRGARGGGEARRQPGGGAWTRRDPGPQGADCGPGPSRRIRASLLGRGPCPARGDLEGRMRGGRPAAILVFSALPRHLARPRQRARRAWKVGAR